MNEMDEVVEMDEMVEMTHGYPRVPTGMTCGLVMQCKLVHGHAYLTILSICLLASRPLSALYPASTPPPSPSSCVVFSSLL